MEDHGHSRDDPKMRLHERLQEATTGTHVASVAETDGPEVRTVARSRSRADCPAGV